MKKIKILILIFLMCELASAKTSTQMRRSKRLIPSLNPSAFEGDVDGCKGAGFTYGYNDEVCYLNCIVIISELNCSNAASNVNSCFWNGASCIE